MTSPTAETCTQMANESSAGCEEVWHEAREEARYLHARASRGLSITSVPRSGARQGEKRRPTDDGSVGRSSAYSSVETLELPLLGNIEDFSQVSSSDTGAIRARPDRVERIRAEIMALLQQRRITSANADGFRGRLLHLVHTRFGRSGKATTRALPDVAEASGNAIWTDTITWDFQLVLKLLNGEQARPYELTPLQGQPLAFYNKASFEPGDILALCNTCTVPPVSCHIPYIYIYIYRIRLFRFAPVAASSRGLLLRRLRSLLND
jgi:hypothetical protein